MTKWQIHTVGEQKGENGCRKKIHGSQHIIIEKGNINDKRNGDW